MAYTKQPDKPKTGPREQQLREMREQRVSQNKTLIDQRAKPPTKTKLPKAPSPVAKKSKNVVAFKKRSGRGR
jgi:hypothetical protein